jgi:nucleoid-associated protein Lsr2
MAREVIYTDDLDGSPNATTITYSFDGQEYEIDLSEANLEKFRESLKPYLEKSRIVERAAVLHAEASGGRGRRRASGGGTARASASGGRSDLAAIRTWAQSQDMDVKDRGRIVSIRKSRGGHAGARRDRFCAVTP